MRSTFFKSRKYKRLNRLTSWTINPLLPKRNKVCLKKISLLTKCHEYCCARPRIDSENTFYWLSLMLVTYVEHIETRLSFEIFLNYIASWCPLVFIIVRFTGIRSLREALFVPSKQKREIYTWERFRYKQGNSKSLQNDYKI